MFESHHYKLFTFTFMLLTIFVKGLRDSDNMRLRNQFYTDVSSGLTDSNLKLALSDLSLDDLKTLQEFIDSEDYKNSDYQENSFGNEKSNTLKFNDFKEDNGNQFSPDYDDYNFEQENNENDLFYDTKSQRNSNQFLLESQRTKRDDQKANITDEYIKQLDYSFPQYEQTNNNNNKSPHVRVKRN